MLARDDQAIVPTATVIGILAAVVQFVGLARWPFLVPALARTYGDPATHEATRQATEVVFESFHRYLGVAIGECLGYLFTGAWTVLVGVSMLQSSSFEPWLAWPGIAIGLALVAGSLEFVGRFEEDGWKLAGTIVPSPTPPGPPGWSPPASFSSSPEARTKEQVEVWALPALLGLIARLKSVLCGHSPHVLPSVERPGGSLGHR